MSKLCSNCGNELQDTAKFCKVCGAKVDDDVHENTLDEKTIVDDTPIVDNEVKKLSKAEKKKEKQLTKTGKLLEFLWYFILIDVIGGLAILLFLENGGDYSRRMSDENILNFILSFIIPVIVCVMMRDMFYSIGHKGNENYYCPKCKKITSHNKYKVCFDCGRDNLVRGITIIASIVIWVITLILVDESYSEVMNLHLIAVFSIFFINLIYMYPARIARRNGHQMAAAIFWLNVFLGVTVIFWVVLLIWASSTSHKQEKTAAAEPTVDMHNDIQSRFSELMKLKEQGFISEEEFQRKREEMISKL